MDLSSSKEAKNAWQMTMEDIIGKNPKVNAAAGNWNEEAFILSTCDPDLPCETIRVTEDAPHYWYNAPGYTVEAHHEFAAARDRLRRRILLMYRLVDKHGAVVLDWSPIGEYDGCNLGIMAAYRGRGAGTAFVKYLIEHGLWAGSIGYSPEGLGTLVKAHRQIVRNALFGKKTVPAAVLSPYGDIVLLPHTNPRFVAYATLHGKTPDQMLQCDTERYPGGKMAGFTLWNEDHLREWAGKKYAPPYSSAELEAYDVWLHEKVDAYFARHYVETVMQG